MDIASVIKDVFPSEETEDYFIPSEHGAPARGALYGAYRTYREELGAVGLAKMRQRKIKRSVEVVTNTDEEASNNVNPEESLEIVENQSDPKSLLLLHWERSRVKRAELLATMSNMNYVGHFPVLQFGNGFEWLLMDFDAKYPGTPNILETWPPFATTIMEYARSYRNKSEHLKTLLKSPEAAANPEVMAIKVLPLVLKTTTKGTAKSKKAARSKGVKSKSVKSKTIESNATESNPTESNATETNAIATDAKKTFRSSKPEVAQEFILHVTVILFN